MTELMHARAATSVLPEQTILTRIRALSAQSRSAEAVKIDSPHNNSLPVARRAEKQEVFYSSNLCATNSLVIKGEKYSQENGAARPEVWDEAAA